MDDPRATKRFIRLIGSFECRDSDGTIGFLNAKIEFERSRSGGAHNDDPVGFLLYWCGQRVEWIEKGRYRTRDGTEVTIDNTEAP
jgi:hypothetical protein